MTVSQSGNLQASRTRGMTVGESFFYRMILIQETKGDYLEARHVLTVPA